MFHTWPVKMSKMEPNSTPSWLCGKIATMASMTPGRKLSTGMDCRMSSKGTMMISARRELAAM